MKERKMVSIPADTHHALFMFLEKQEKETGLKVTASSFAENAIKNAIKQGVHTMPTKVWAIDRGTNS